MKKATKKLFAAAAGAAVGTAAVRTVHGTARNMADMAMNRELSEPQKRLMQAAPGSPKEQELEKQKDAAAERQQKKEELIFMDGETRLVRVRSFIEDHGWKYNYSEEDGCGSIDFEYRGLAYHIYCP